MSLLLDPAAAKALLKPGAAGASEMPVAQTLWSITWRALLSSSALFCAFLFGAVGLGFFEPMLEAVDWGLDDFLTFALCGTLLIVWLHFAEWRPIKGHGYVKTTGKGHGYVKTTGINFWKPTLAELARLEVTGCARSLKLRGLDDMGGQLWQQEYAWYAVRKLDRIHRPGSTLIVEALAPSGARHVYDLTAVSQEVEPYLGRRAA